jgi:hypothetical protein
MLCSIAGLDHSAVLGDECGWIERRTDIHRLAPD